MAIKYPSLILPQFCKTPIKITIHSEDITEDGAPATALEIETLCNYQSSGKTKQRTTDGKTVQIVEISGKAYIPGDIAENIPEITGGEAEIFGEVREIYKGTKARNPDGSVNYTFLELI